MSILPGAEKMQNLEELEKFSYTFKAGVINDTSKDLLGRKECNESIYFQNGATLRAPLPNYGTPLFLYFFNFPDRKLKFGMHTGYTKCNTTICICMGLLT